MIDTNVGFLGNGKKVLNLASGRSNVRRWFTKKELQNPPDGYRVFYRFTRGHFIMIKRILISLLIPLSVCALMFFLRDFFESTNRFGFASFMGNVINIVYYWPLIILQQTHLLGKNLEDLHMLWGSVSMVFSIAIHVGIIYWYFDPDVEET